jgi:hypothetical protein
MDHRVFPDTSRRWTILDIIQTSLITKKMDTSTLFLFATSESETTVLRYRNRPEPLKKTNHIQLMELRAKTIRWN